MICRFDVKPSGLRHVLRAGVSYKAPPLLTVQSVFSPHKPFSYYEQASYKENKEKPTDGK